MAMRSAMAATTRAVVVTFSSDAIVAQGWMLLPRLRNVRCRGYKCRSVGGRWMQGECD
jgi:hypothetical protein